MELVTVVSRLSTRNAADSGTIYRSVEGSVQGVIDFGCTCGGWSFQLSARSSLNDEMGCGEAGVDWELPAEFSPSRSNRLPDA